MDKTLQKRLNRVVNVLEKLAASKTYKVACNELLQKFADKDIPTRDNQNVDLDAFKRQMQKEKEHREKVHKEQSKRFKEDQKRYQEAGWQRPDWQKFRGENVIRVAEEPYIAIPSTGKKNAKKFVIVDIRLIDQAFKNPVITHLKKDELFKWFFATWKREHGF